MDEGLIAAADSVSHAFCDIDGRLGVFLDGEESLAHGDFDFRFRPRNDVAAATDETDGQRIRACMDIDAAVFFHRTTEGEGLCDVVGLVFEQGLFDEQIEVSFGQAQAATLVEGLGQRICNAMGDVRNELTVDVGEDGILIVAA